VNIASRRVSAVSGGGDLYSPVVVAGRTVERCTIGRHSETALFNVATGRWADLVSGSDGYGWPNWSRDSASIVVQHGAALERVHVPDGVTTRVGSLEGIRQVVVDGGEAGIGLTPDDEAILVRQVAPTREIYALDVDWP